MKNKYIAILLCSGFLIAGLIAAFITYFGGYYHQHMEENEAVCPDANAVRNGEWVVFDTTGENNHFRNYVFTNLAGDICGNVPVTKYATDGRGNSVQMAETPAGALDERAEYIFAVYPKNPDDSSESRLNTFGIYQHYIKSCGSVNLIYPDNAGEKAKEEIEDEISYFEKTIYSYDFNKTGDFIDKERFIRFYIITEVAVPQFSDEMPLYIFKNEDGRYEPFAAGFMTDSQNPESDFSLTFSYLYTMLFKDKDFVDGVVNEYRALREDELSDESLDDYITRAVGFIEKYYSTGKSIENEEKELRNYIKKRLSWMDDNIESLYQYCARSSIKHFSDEPY